MCLMAACVASVFTSMSTLMHACSRPGTAISCLQSSGTLVQPSALAAAAGNSALRSSVVVKKTAAMSTDCTRLASTIATSRRSDAEMIAAEELAAAVMAPRIPRTAMSGLHSVSLGRSLFGCFVQRAQLGGRQATSFARRQIPKGDRAVRETLESDDADAELRAGAADLAIVAADERHLELCGAIRALTHAFGSQRVDGRLTWRGVDGDAVAARYFKGRMGEPTAEVAVRRAEQ